MCIHKYVFVHKWDELPPEFKWSPESNPGCAGVSSKCQSTSSPALPSMFRQGRSALCLLTSTKSLWLQLASGRVRANELCWDSFVTLCSVCAAQPLDIWLDRVFYTPWREPVRGLTHFTELMLFKKLVQKDNYSSFTSLFCLKILLLLLNQSVFCLVVSLFLSFPWFWSCSFL